MITKDERKIAMNSLHGVAYDTSASLGWVQIGEEQIRYDDFVRKLFKQLPEPLMHLHGAMGCAEEAGELSDVIKRNKIYCNDQTAEGKPIRVGIVEELGDLRFYMQAVMNLYGVSEQEVLQHNACKLQQRYEKLVYSDQAAQARADKKEGE